MLFSDAGSAPSAEVARLHVGGCQNYGPFLGTLNNRCRIILGTQKRTIILTTTHVGSEDSQSCGLVGLGPV